MTSFETVQIYFPKSQVKQIQSGDDQENLFYLIGFNISGFQTTVIFIEENSDIFYHSFIQLIIAQETRKCTQQFKDFVQFDRLLWKNNLSLRFDDECQQLFIKQCKMVILGRIFEEGDEITEYCKQQMETYDLWIDIEYSSIYNQQEKQIQCQSQIQENRKLGDKYKIKTLLCFGYKYKTKSQVIFYDQIQQNSLLSINPNKVKSAFSNFDIPHQFIESYYDTRNKQDNDIQLEEYFKKHIDVSDFDVNLCQMEAIKQDIFNNKYYQNLPELEYTIKQINFSNMINQIYQEELKSHISDQKEQPEQATQQPEEGKQIHKITSNFIHDNQQKLFCQAIY